MFFAMAGMAVMNSIKGMNEAKAQNTMNKANTEIANIQRKSANERSAAVAALNNMQQSIKNNDMLRTSGKQIENLNEQHVQLGKQMTVGGLKQRLDAAAQAGALVAAAGARGVGGGSIDALNATLDLTSEIGQSEQERAYNHQIFQLDEAARETTYQMYNQINTNQYQANINVADIIGPAKLDDSWQSAALKAGGSILSGMYQMGMFSKGGTFDMSTSSGGVSGLFNRALGRESAPASNYQLGAKLL